MLRSSLLVLTMVTAVATITFAAMPGSDLLIPAAARGAGAEDSIWFTAINMANPTDQQAEVTVFWIDRDAPTATPLSALLTLKAGEVRVENDALLDLFGIAAGGGALRFVSDQKLVVTAEVLNRSGDKEYGQGFDAVPVETATAAGGTTQVLGVSNNSSRRHHPGAWCLQQQQPAAPPRCLVSPTTAASAPTST